LAEAGELEWLPDLARCTRGIAAEDLLANARPQMFCPARSDFPSAVVIRERPVQARDLVAVYSRLLLSLRIFAACILSFYRDFSPEIRIFKLVTRLSLLLFLRTSPLAGSICRTIIY